MYKNVFGFFRNWASLFNIAYESKSHSVVSDSLQPHGIQSMQFSIPEYWSGKPSYPMLERVLPNPGIEPRSPSLQADSLLAEPQGKPKNTEVGSLSLLQQIFPTQESNRGLLHCRWVLYQLSYQGTLQAIIAQNVNFQLIFSVPQQLTKYFSAFAIITRQTI